MLARRAREQRSDEVVVLVAGGDRIAVVDRQAGSLGVDHDRVEIRDSFSHSEPFPRMTGFAAVTHGGWSSASDVRRHLWVTEGGGLSPDRGVS
jgi:hypothetical protein